MRPADPVELEAPDLEPYRTGSTGIPWFTGFDSGRPGPHVLLTALVHGNELCGAIALDRLLRLGVRPCAGRLSLGFCNIAAYHRFDPADPTASRYVEEDFNRVWDAAMLDGPRHSVELDRARAIRPLVDTADVLLDIHSMQYRQPPLMLAGPLAKGRALAERLGFPGTIVCDAGHAAGRRLRDYGAFADPASPKNALLIECGQHWETASAAVAMEAAMRFLLLFGMIDEAVAAPYLTAPPPRQQVIEVTEAVTVRSDDFAFVRDFAGMEVVEKAGTVIAREGNRPVVTPYDRCILIMPARRLVRGQTAVRLGHVVG